MKNKIQKRILILLLISYNLIFCIKVLLSDSSAIYESYETPEELSIAINYFNHGIEDLPDRDTMIKDVETACDYNTHIISGDFDKLGQGFISLPVVILSNDIVEHRFPLVLAHEIQHNKFVIHEYRANYNAIVDLWESDVSYLKFCASLFAHDVLNGGYLNRPEYDCSGLLVEYALRNI